MYVIGHTANAENFSSVIGDITQNIGIQVSLMLLIYGRQTAIGTPNDVIDKICVTHSAKAGEMQVICKSTSFFWGRLQRRDGDGDNPGGALAPVASLLSQVVPPVTQLSAFADVECVFSKIAVKNLVCFEIFSYFCKIYVDIFSYTIILEIIIHLFIN